MNISNVKMLFSAAGRFTKDLGQSFLLTYRQIKRGDSNILIFITYGLMFDVFFNLHRPFAVRFLTRLGGVEQHVFLLSSLPGVLAVFALIPGSLIINRFRRKKGIISFFFGMSRLFVLALVFVPFLPVGLRPIMFVLLISIMNFPEAISQSGLQGFLGDVFDGFSRSKAITLRNKFGQIIVPMVALTTGLIVTFIPNTDAQTIIVYQIFFVAAFCFGVAEVLTFRRFKEKDSDSIEEKNSIEEKDSPKEKDSLEKDVPEIKAATKTKDEPSGIRVIPSILKDKRFMGYLILTIFFYFMLHSGWPLFSILQVIDLGATEWHMAVNVAVSGLFGFIGAGFWGRLIAKKGNDFAAFIASVGLVFNIFATATSPNIWVYILWQTVGGFIGVGFIISLLNGLLAYTPEKNRVIYICVYNTFVNISLGLSPFFAGALHGALGTRLSMAVVGIGRILAALAMFVIYLRSRNKTSVI